MKITCGLAVAAALAWSGVAVAAPKLPAVVSAADRAVPGRRIEVTLPQTEIGTAIDLGRIAPVSGGDGLIGSLLVARSDDRAKTMSAIHQERAEAVAAPVRAVLRSMDVQALALRTARSVAAATGWSAADHMTVAGIAASATTPAVTTIAFRYDLSPDASQIRVFADVTLSQRGPARLQTSYRQRLVSIVQLPTRSYDEVENAAQWSRDGGRLARQALSSAFARLEKTIPYAVSLTSAEANALVDKSHPKTFAAGLYGPLVSRDPADPGSVLLWSDAFIAVQTAS